MDGGIALLILLILGVPLFVAVWLIVRAVQSGTQLETLGRRIEALEAELRRLNEKPPAEPTRAPEPQPPKPETKSAVEQILEKRELERPKPIEPRIVHPVQPPPPQPTPVFQQPPPPAPALQPTPRPAAPPPIAEPAWIRPTPAPGPAINWEQFMGVKLFAWVGGLALFLGVAFFVKYSFDNNLISPEVRVAIGFIVGIGLLIGGVLTSRKNYLVLAHTLCATGIVILYAITFAARSYYHFLWWPDRCWDALPAFAIMALITATGFALAVRLNALVVAILGMLGGFLTPILLSTGVDNPGGLFGYIAILDAGLIFIALYRRWFFLTALAAGERP